MAAVPQRARGIAGFNLWLADHLRELRRSPSDNLMSQLIQKAESGSAETHLNDIELLGIAGLVLAAGFETTVNLLSNGIRMLLDAPEHLGRCASALSCGPTPLRRSCGWTRRYSSPPGSP